VGLERFEPYSSDFARNFLFFVFFLLFFLEAGFKSGSVIPKCGERDSNSTHHGDITQKPSFFGVFGHFLEAGAKSVGGSFQSAGRGIRTLIY
jgi:hypothetical protein